MATGAVNGVLGVVFVFVFVIVICCKCCMQCEIFLFAIFNSAQGRGVEGENRSSVLQFLSLRVVAVSSPFARGRFFVAGDVSVGRLSSLASSRRRRRFFVAPGVAVRLNFVGLRVVVVAPVSVSSSSYFPSLRG